MPSDDYLRQELQRIDDDEDLQVSRWEADFLESILFKWRGPLSSKQRKSAQEMIERYLVSQ
jgi:late competence protein required for DNA uptake (superfamily II DNA/RNA helicase)